MWMLRLPVTALRAYLAREDYFVKCRAVGVSSKAAKAALEAAPADLCAADRCAVAFVGLVLG